MLNQGKLAILAILGLAVLASCLSVWWRHHAGNRAQAFWGTESAFLIRHARKVEVLRLGATDPSTPDDVERLNIDGLFMPVLEKKDISRMTGLVHARHALIEDASFEWDKPRGNCPPRWTCAMKFSDDDRVATVVFDFPCQRVRLIPHQREVAVSQQICKGLWKYTEGQWEVGPAALSPQGNAMPR